jgi:hypothetical protein
MPLSTLLHLEYDPVEPTDAMKHMVFSCQQTKGPNLEVLPATATQRFAVLYGEELDDDLIGVLERAYASDTLSPVKLIAAEENKLYIFLDSAVASATVPMIESLWANVVETGDGSWAVSFATETEALSGRSDFKCWDDAKEVLESYSLGIGSFDSPARDGAELSIHAYKKETHLDPASEHQDTLAAGNICPQASSPHELPDQSPCVPCEPWMDRSMCADPRLLSNTELMALGNTVHSCKSLRDACLRAMLMSTSIRMVELTSIKVEDVIISETAVKVRINAFKSRRSMHRFLAPAITSDVLCRYVQEYHLSPEDYLFPSAINASRPLSIREVRVAFDRWLRDAQIKREQLIPSSIRSTFTRLNQSITPQSIAEMTGHGSLPKTLDYISLLYLPHDQ